MKKKVVNGLVLTNDVPTVEGIYWYHNTEESSGKAILMQVARDKHNGSLVAKEIAEFCPLYLWQLRRKKCVFWAKIPNAVLGIQELSFNDQRIAKCSFCNE